MTTRQLPGEEEAVRWDRNAPIRKLNDLGFDSGATAINRHSTVVGYSGDQPARWIDGGGLYVYDSPGATLLGHNQAADAVGTSGGEGVLWLGRRRATLGPDTSPRDISDTGWAVGVASSRAVRWEASEFTSAEFLAPAPSAAAEVNDAGVIGGTVGAWAATWDAAGAQTMLPVLSGSNRSQVTGLSENGQVIGIAGFANGTYRAVVWR